MTEEKFLWFLEVVDRARQGDLTAKEILLVILETERRPTILGRLAAGDVRPEDRPDGHHDVVVQVDQKIGQLRVTRAYFKWETRIINEVCRKFRGSYRFLGEPLDGVLAEAERKHQVEEAFYDYPPEPR